MLSEQHTLKRLRVGESTVDPNQVSIGGVAARLFEASKPGSDGGGGDDGAKALAIKELKRFQLGPVRTCRAVLAMCGREEEELLRWKLLLTSETETANLKKHQLESQVAKAKLLPKQEVELLANECELIPIQRKLLEEQAHKHSMLEALIQKRDLLQSVVLNKQKKLAELQRLTKEL
ncbi:hypothetical protein BASA81_003976 [Batrachochytrium salamandrivorans]|nr:hypothetical protein BASA81_003976 [Batrachochytrium salamandrivorans]